MEKWFYKKAKYLILASLLSMLWVKAGLAQVVPDFPQEEDVRVLPLAALYDRILEYHPLVRQAGLLTEEASRQVMEARGVFDPKLQSSYDRKIYASVLKFISGSQQLIFMSNQFCGGFLKLKGTPFQICSCF